MKLLISVRNEAEALLAAAHGADFIDLKEPRDGALGGLPVAAIAAIVRALRRAHGPGLPISATIGDLPMGESARIAEAVEAVGACGVDYVKVGIERAPAAAAVLGLLARSRHAIVPVFIADRGLDFELLAQACRAGFPAVMADTADKQAGSLFDCCAAAELRRFIDAVGAAGKLAGLAGALRLQHLAALQQLAPDFAGFRSAVCEGERSSGLDERRVRALADRLRERAPA